MFYEYVRSVHGSYSCLHKNTKEYIREMCEHIMLRIFNTSQKHNVMAQGLQYLQKTKSVTTNLFKYQSYRPEADKSSITSDHIETQI